MTALAPQPASVAGEARLGPAATRKGRLEFLDGLRGIAALAVALQHGAELLWPAYLRWSVEVFRPGEFGVFVFFISSGFIIPASLEKYGSVKRFWIGRFFRLFPLYWFGLLAIAVLHVAFDAYPVPALGDLGWPLNLTMVQGFTAQPNIIGAAWTLAFEMAFYLGCSLLLLAGLHKRSPLLAVGLLVGGAFGGTLVPSYFLSGPPGFYPGEKRVATALLAVAAVAAVALWFAPRVRTVQLGIIALSLILVPLVLNRGESWWFALLMFGAMFTGTTLFRWHRGEVSGRVAAGVTALSVLAFNLGAYLNVEDRVDASLANAHHTWRPEAFTFTMAVLLFCAGLALRHRTFPAWLTYLGAISYSVYLAHAVVIHVVPEIGNRFTTMVIWMGLVIGVSAVTYRWIERPFQAMGQRLAARTTPTRT